MQFVYLSHIDGISRKSGTDAYGCDWIEVGGAFGEFEESEECAVCGDSIWDGWMCLDGGVIVCESHIKIVPEWFTAKMGGNNSECIDWQNGIVGMRTTIGAAFLDCFNAKHADGKYLGWVAPKEEIANA